MRCETCVAEWPSNVTLIAAIAIVSNFRATDNLSLLPRFPLKSNGFPAILSCNKCLIRCYGQFSISNKQINRI